MPHGVGRRNRVREISARLCEAAAAVKAWCRDLWKFFILLGQKGCFQGGIPVYRALVMPGISVFMSDVGISIR
jgi:hypothetical protein